MKKAAMEKEKIRSILENHSVPFYEENGRIYADSMIGGTTLFEYIEDLTEFTEKELFAWLGY